MRVKDLINLQIKQNLSVNSSRIRIRKSERARKIFRQIIPYPLVIRNRAPDTTSAGFFIESKQKAEKLLLWLVVHHPEVKVEKEKEELKDLPRVQWH